MGKDFGSHIRWQFLELRFKLVADVDVPSHHLIMAYNTYGLKIISDLRSPQDCRFRINETYDG